MFRWLMLYFLTCALFAVWMTGNLPKVLDWLGRKRDNFLYWLKKRSN
jgi:hypothetical protein